MNNILVVAAHPDDEILGCGGTIVKHINNGDNVHVLILAEGITSRDKNRNPNKSRKKETHKFYSKLDMEASHEGYKLFF